MIRIRHKVLKAEGSLLYGTAIVTCELPSGARNQLQAQLRDLTHADKVAKQVMQRGTVDITLWAPLAPRAGSAADIAARALAASEQIMREQLEAEHRRAA